LTRYSAARDGICFRFQLEGRQSHLNEAIAVTFHRNRDTFDVRVGAERGLLLWCPVGAVEGEQPTELNAKPKTSNRKQTPMYVSIHHTIKDAQKWDQTVKNITTAMEQGRVPQGLKPLMYLPSVDGRQANCVWEAGSMESLKAFMDRGTGGAAQNEYFPINAQAALGLPAQEAAGARA
jgi:hypothetical protein